MSNVVTYEPHYSTRRGYFALLVEIAHDAVFDPDGEFLWGSVRLAIRQGKIS